MSSVKPTGPAPALPAMAPHLPIPAPRAAPFAGVLAAAFKPLAAAKTSDRAPAMGLLAPRRHEPDGHKHSRRRDDDELDPSARQAAQLAPPPVAQPADDVQPAQGAAQAHARVSLEELLPALVKRIAWSGDAQRGTVRMELGAGELAGATLMVSSEGGRVRVQLQAPPGTDVGSWRERLRGRLEAKGLSIESLEVE